MFASMLLSILLAGAPDAPGPLPCDDAHAWADFDRTHEELSLVGAAPLYGLADERTENAAVRALNVRSAVPSDAAPLFGIQEPAAPRWPECGGRAAPRWLECGGRAARPLDTSLVGAASH